MLDEEVIKKNTQNVSERILIANVMLVVLLPALLFGGNSSIGSGLLAAFGLIAPVNIIIFSRVWPDAPRWVFFKYLLALSPFIALLAISIAGAANPCVVKIVVDKVQFFELLQDVSYPICSAAGSLGEALFPPFENLAIVATAVSVYFICDSRYILRRMLSYCVLGVTALAILGILLHLSSSFQSFGNIFTTRADYFSTFAKSSEWCVFAAIWMSAAFACALYSSAHKTLSSFVVSFRFLMLACACALFYTCMLTGAPVDSICAAAIFGIGMFLMAFSARPSFKDFARKIRHGHYTSALARLASPCAYLAACVFALSAGLGMFSDSISNPKERLLVYENSPITLEQKNLVLEDSAKLIREKPLFGWGSGSFPTIFSFAQGADVPYSGWSSPTSDLVKKLVENGVVGLCLAFLLPAFLFVYQLPRLHFGPAGFIMFCAVLSVAGLSIVCSPLEGGSVYASFWIILMSFFTWSKKNVE